MQKRADVMLGRASRSVRRGSMVLAVGWLGLACLGVAWVMFNLAMHGWASARWSVLTAHFVLMGINLLGGALLMVFAAWLAPRVQQHKAPRSRKTPPRASPEQQQLLPAESAPPADSIESALGSAIELGLLAAQTIPQIVRVFRRPKPKSEAPE